VRETHPAAPSSGTATDGGSARSGWGAEYSLKGSSSVSAIRSLAHRLTLRGAPAADLRFDLVKLSDPPHTSSAIGADRALAIS